MHAIPSHYHHYAHLLTFIEHIRWRILEPWVDACWICSVICLCITLTHNRHYGDLSESIKHLKYLSGTFCLSSVCKIWFQLSLMQYKGLCVFSLPSSLMMVVRIRALYLIIIIKWAVWPICHCLGQGHKTIVYAVCLFMYSYDLRIWPQNVVYPHIWSIYTKIYNFL